MTEVPQKRVPIEQAVARVEETTGLKFEDDGKPNAEVRYLYNIAVRAAQIEQAQSPEAGELKQPKNHNKRSLVISTEVVIVVARLRQAFLSCWQ